MKIYTKTGDKGETSLFGGQRVWKDNLRIASYGTIDELNAILGVCSTEIKTLELKSVIEGLQNDLFTLGSDLATPFEKGNKGFVIPRVDSSFTKRLEDLIDKYDSLLPELKNFILPGGLKGSALLQHARTVSRRAEREVVSLSKNEEITEEIEIYLNRLSDLLFVLARYENYFNNVPDVLWQK